MLSILEGKPSKAMWYYDLADKNRLNTLGGHYREENWKNICEVKHV